MRTTVAQLCEPCKHQCASVERYAWHMSAEKVFAENVRRIVADKYASPNAAARAWKVAQKTLEAIMKETRTPGIDTAERVSKAAGYELWQMLQPNMDLRHPPALQPASLEGRELFNRLLDLAKDASRSTP